MIKQYLPNRLDALAVKWRTLGMMAVAFARQIVMAEKMRAHSGAAKAELLEAWLYAALVQLSADIAAASDIRRPNKDERYALTYLKTAHALLSVLVLTISEIRRQLDRAAERLSNLAGKPPNTFISMRSSLMGDQTYLDSS